MLRGHAGKALFPEDHEEKNNLQKMVVLGDTVINRAFELTINQTTAEVIQNIMDFPKESLKNSACLAPRIIRKLRDKNAMENPLPLFRRRYFEDLHGASGKVSTITVILQLMSQPYLTLIYIYGNS